MNHTQTIAWKRFLETGSVEAYLRYRAIARRMEENSED